MYRVIIAGGRDFQDYARLCKTMDHLLSNKTDVVIISGGARGADALGERYARERGLRCIRVPADWNKYGKRAGYLRNVEMAEQADALAAFWDGKSKGTGHMRNIAAEKGLAIRTIYYR